MPEMTVTTETNLFDILPENLRETMRSRARQVSYKAGEVMHQRGDAASSLSLIERGRVRVSNLARNGDRITIAELGPGESFGLFPLLTIHTRSHDADALTDVEVLEVGKSVFRHMMDDAPDLRDHIISHLASRLLRAMEAVEDARRYPLKIRLAKLLLRRAEQAGEFAATQATLADELGVSRYGLSLALKAFTTQGFVKTGYGRIVILDSNALDNWIDRQS